MTLTERLAQVLDAYERRRTGFPLGYEIETAVVEAARAVLAEPRLSDPAPTPPAEGGDAGRIRSRADDGCLIHGVSAPRTACARCADDLRAEVERLREALTAIRDFKAEYVPLALDNDGCEECARRRAQNWPPSGLCEKHYGAMASNRQRNENAENRSQYRMREIARAALAAYDEAKKGGGR